MRQDVKRGLQKIRDDLKRFRTTFFFRGGGILVRPMTNANLVATCYFINAVSLLDEGLDAYIRANHPRQWKRRMDLRDKIGLLKQQGVLQFATRLHDLRKARNRCAHEAGRFADLAELDGALVTIEAAYAAPTALDMRARQGRMFIGRGCGFEMLPLPPYDLPSHEGPRRWQQPERRC